MSHNQLVFGIILAGIFGLCSLLLYRLLFSEEPQQTSHTTSSADVGQIEETLKKILSQTAAVAPSSSSDGAVPPEVEKMKQELEISQRMIEELKSKTSGAGAVADNTPELLAKIKVLEDRLVEYEIIEDDIADLSVYKEENAKLKRELEGIKSGAGTSPIVADFAAAVENAPIGTELRGESVEEALAAADALMEGPQEAAAAQAPAPFKNNIETPPTPTPSAAEKKAAEELDAAVAAAMGSTTGSSAPAPAAVAPTPPPPEPTPAPVAAAPAPVASPAPAAAAPPEGGTEDVFAEFQGEDNKDLLSELGDIDADRMLEEIKDLGEGMSADADVLNEEVDLEKMAKESAKG